MASHHASLGVEDGRNFDCRCRCETITLCMVANLIMIQSAVHPKSVMSARRFFDCLFTATSITVVVRPINQAPGRYIDVNRELFILFYAVFCKLHLILSNYWRLLCERSTNSLKRIKFAYILMLI